MEKKAFKLPERQAQGKWYKSIKESHKVKLFILIIFTDFISYELWIIILPLRTFQQIVGMKVFFSCWIERAATSRNENNEKLITINPNEMCAIWFNKTKASSINKH